MRAGFRNSPKWGMLLWEGDQMVSWQANDGIKSAVTGPFKQWTFRGVVLCSKFTVSSSTEEVRNCFYDGWSLNA
ncbi:hypothetical protein SDJN02_03305, partial [Cucurbita argyrosperma subsp. argyrosperma]